jgi:hypothetical protein
LPLRDALRIARDRTRPALPGDLLREAYEGTLDPAHVDAAMALGDAGIYSGATRDISAEFICCGINTVDHANALLDFIRPEEDPHCIWLGANTAPTIVAACARFGTEAAAGAMPSWRFAAFWWLSFAVRFGIPAHDLAVFIHSFRGKLESCAIWWRYCGKGAPSHSTCSTWEKQRAVMWWGRYGDLRHAGLLSHDAKLQIDPPLDRLRQHTAGSWILPSILQPRAWRSEENEAWRQRTIDERMRDGRLDEEVTP